MAGLITTDGIFFSWDGEEVDAMELVRCLGISVAPSGSPDSRSLAAATLVSVQEEGQVNIEPDVIKALDGWIYADTVVEEAVGGRYDGRWFFVPSPRC